MQVAAEAGFHLHGVEWLLVVGAVVIALVALVALAVAAVWICGVPVLGLPPHGLHFSHRSKRMAGATTMAVVLVVVGAVVAVNRSSPLHGDDGVTHVAAGATTTSPPGVSNDPGTSGTTGTTRTSTHRPRGAATTGAQLPGTSAARRASSTTAARVSPLGHTPTTRARGPRRHPTSTTTPRHGHGTTTTTTTQGSTTTTEGSTTTTTQPETTTTTPPPPLVGDLNLDGLVGCIDESVLVPELGELGSGLIGDLNHDGVVDPSDLTVMLGNWTGDGTTWVNPLDPLQICL